MKLQNIEDPYNYLYKHRFCTTNNKVYIFIIIIFIIIIIIIMAVQPFVVPWRLFQFLGPIHSR
jgi:hypothetical protein